MSEFDASKWISLFPDHLMIPLKQSDIETLKSLIHLRFLSENKEKSSVFQEMMSDLCERYDAPISDFILKHSAVGVFCKMSMKSGKNDSKTICVPKFTSREIFEELTNSLEIKTFLDLFPNQGILLSRFQKEIVDVPQNEFRIFVRNSKIEMISNFISEFELDDIPLKLIEDAICNFPFEKFCADIFISKENSANPVLVIEVNPWDSRTGVGRFARTLSC